MAFYNYFADLTATINWVKYYIRFSGGQAIIIRNDSETNDLYFSFDVGVTTHGRLDPCDMVAMDCKGTLTNIWIKGTAGEPARIWAW